MLTKGDLNQQAIQRKLLAREEIEHTKVDVYCSIPTECIKRFVSIMYDYRIEGWWLYNEELTENDVCTVEQYRDSLRESVRR